MMASVATVANPSAASAQTGTSSRAAVAERGKQAAKRIELWADGAALPYTTYDRLGEIDQGAIVENKRLGHVLAIAAQVQALRDSRQQAGPSRTLQGHPPAPSRAAECQAAAADQPARSGARALGSPNWPQASIRAGSKKVFHAGHIRVVEPRLANRFRRARRTLESSCHDCIRAPGRREGTINP